jgi:hypothetical protein
MYDHCVRSWRNIRDARYLILFVILLTCAAAETRIFELADVLPFHTVAGVTSIIPTIPAHVTFPGRIGNFIRNFLEDKRVVWGAAGR